MLTSRTARWVGGTALLCLTLLALTYVLLLAPRRAEAAELQEQQVVAEARNDALRIKLLQLKDQFLKLPESQARFAEILAQLPVEPQTPTLVRDLDTMAKGAGVSLLHVTPGSPAAVDGVEGVQAVPQEIEIEGDYFDTVVFLRKLQGEMKRAFLVTGLDLAGASGGSATSGRVSMKITGRTFLLTSVDPSLATKLSTAGAAGTTGTAGTTAATGTTGTTAATAATPAPSASEDR
jgi:type IV pilus assembly protein PilO